MMKLEVMETCFTLNTEFMMRGLDGMLVMDIAAVFMTTEAIANGNWTFG